MSKRIIDPFKEKILADEAKRNARPPVTPPNGIHLKDLLEDTKVILFREINELMSQSAVGLLDKDSSQSLVNYIKLLKDLIKDENALFDKLSDEELEKLAKDK